MSKSRAIVVITWDLALSGIVERVLGDSCRVVPFTTMQSSLDYVYNTTPDMMIVHIDPASALTINILNELKGDPIFGHVPLLAVLNDDFPLPNWDFLYVEDYIRKSSLEAELHAKVDLCMRRAERVVEINPLTRLPGNIAINKQIQKRLDAGEVFALAYADLDF
ncbi:MAG TPA: hypothetical protein VF790_00100, partial [Dissulfurispiraceae bacterium]